MKGKKISLLIFEFFYNHGALSRGTQYYFWIHGQVLKDRSVLILDFNSMLRRKNYILLFLMWCDIDV